MIGKSERRLVELRHAINEGSTQFLQSLEHRSASIQTELRSTRQVFLQLDQSVCHENETRSENDQTIQQYAQVKFQALLDNWDKSHIAQRSDQLHQDIQLLHHKIDKLLQGTVEKRHEKEKELATIVEHHHRSVDALQAAMNEERAQVAQFDSELQRALRTAVDPLEERILVESKGRQRLFETLAVDLNHIVSDQHRSPQRKLMDRVVGELMVDMETLRQELQGEKARQMETTVEMTNTMNSLIEEARRAVDRFNAVRGVDQIGRGSK